MRPSVILGLLGLAAEVICASKGYPPKIKEIIKKAKKGVFTENH